MNLSILIATKDRRTVLEACLTSLAKLRYDEPWEVIVADNGSPEESAAWLRRYAKTTPYALRVLSLPAPGKSRALNRALALATGDVIVFIDDDCYPVPEYLQQIRAVFDDPQVHYMGGRIVLYDPADYPITIAPQEKPREFAPGTFVAAGSVHGANMAFRKSVLERLGGFDEMLGPGTPFPCEDADLVLRASQAGCRGGFFPGPLVYHHHGRRDPRDVRRLIAAYAHGRGALFAKFVLTSGWPVQSLKRWVWLWNWPKRWEIVRELVGGLHYGWRRLLAGFIPGRLTSAAARVAAPRPHPSGRTQRA